MRPVNSSIRYNFAVADDVILVAGEQLVGAQRLVDVVHDGRAFGIVEVCPPAACRARAAFLPELVALVGEGDVARFLVQLEVFIASARDQLVDGEYSSERSSRRAGNDQWGARLVDQDAVDLVHDREVVDALDHVFQIGLHVVAQIVEAQLVVRGIGDIGSVGARFLVVQAVRETATSGQPSERRPCPSTRRRARPDSRSP